MSYFIRKFAVAGVIVLALFLGAFGMFKIVPGSLLPDEDQGMIMVATQLDPSASLSSSESVGAQLEKIIMQQPSVSDELTFAGFDMLSSTMKSNSIASFIKLKPWEERKTKELSSAGLVAKLYVLSQMQIPVWKVTFKIAVRAAQRNCRPRRKSLLKPPKNGPNFPASAPPSRRLFRSTP